MGADLFDRYADWTRAADAQLGYSIRALCLDDPRSELGLTAFTQPALFVVNALTWRDRVDSGKPRPDFVAGHSLGEYNALLAAEVFDFQTGLALVQRRGQIMGQVSGGGMAAILGLDPTVIRDVLSAADAGQRLDVANFNSFDQTVIAGPNDDLLAMQRVFEEAGAKAYIPLNVSAPFHSRYMRAPQTEFAGFLDGFNFSAPAIPVISNVTGKPYEADQVRQTLSQQIGHSVRWLDSVLFLLNQPDPQFEEVGPGNVLTKLVGQIRRRRSPPRT
jgi:malonyl CoA-acyl carrier protein transacylase